MTASGALYQYVSDVRGDCRPRASASRSASMVASTPLLAERTVSHPATRPGSTRARTTSHAPRRPRGLLGGPIPVQVGRGMGLAAALAVQTPPHRASRLRAVASFSRPVRKSPSPKCARPVRDRASSIKEPASKSLDITNEYRLVRASMNDMGPSCGRQWGAGRAAVALGKVHWRERRRRGAAFRSKKPAFPYAPTSSGQNLRTNATRSLPFSGSGWAPMFSRSPSRFT